MLYSRKQQRTFFSSVTAGRAQSQFPSQQCCSSTLSGSSSSSLTFIYFNQNYFQENRREYEKRVASIVEQSWYFSYSFVAWKLVPNQRQSYLGWCFLKRVKERRLRVNLQQTEAAVESWYNVNTVPFILSDADEWTLQTRNYYNVNSLKFIFRMNSSKIYTVALLHIFQLVLGKSTHQNY